MILGIFFLKQKTAYEMRISDWSSDVCSSDLTRGQLGVAYLGARAFNIAPLVRISRPDAASILSALDDGAVGVMVPHVSSAEKARDIEIGRASCRERVCQYV